jgi:histidinol dehydrogenase
MRHYTVQELSRDGVEALKDTIVQMTNAEGLMAHQRAILTRARKIEQGK